jgi:hypothetical protein
MKIFAQRYGAFTHDHQALYVDINQKPDKLVGITVYNTQVINKMAPLYMSLFAHRSLHYEIIFSADGLLAAPRLYMLFSAFIKLSRIYGVPWYNIFLPKAALCMLYFVYFIT